MTAESNSHHAGPGARPGLLTRVVATAALTLFSTTAWAVDFVTTPTVTQTRSATGFKHPALGFTPEQLEFTRRQIRADVQPYQAYYRALTTVCCGYADIDLQPTNRDASQVDTPGTPDYNSTGVQNRFIHDSQGALTQALLYFVTGRNEHRRNAMRIIRTWSHMNPKGYAYFADAHIHNGVPLARLLMAAEMLRYSTADTSYTAYPLAWTDNDSRRLKDNLIDPMERAFFASNERFMNQHSYSLAGRLAGAIFTDNRDRYDETVEWMTVNATSKRQDINGAIRPLIPLVKAGDPLNRFGVDFHQIQEMQRDQAHGGDNVDILAGLARMVHAQGTLVDPTSGRPSSARNAVSIYRFDDNRLLMGANSFARYMLGYRTPWADLSGGTARISTAYRGRLNAVDAFAEIYNAYRYVEGVDVDTLAPYLATASRHADGPAVPWGKASPANKDFGSTALLTLPPELSGIPLPATGPLETERKSIFLKGRWTQLTEDGRTFGRADATPAGATLVFHDIQYADRSRFAPIGLMLRTRAAMTLAASGEEDSTPWSVTAVPNTHGEWRHVVIDSAAAVTAGKRLGDHIIYFKFTGAEGTTVDIDFVNMAAPTQLTAPHFRNPFPDTDIAVTGAPYSATHAAVDADASDKLAYEAIKLPAGATLNEATDEIRWTPTAQQLGIHDVILAVTDGTSISTVTTTLNVQPDRASALQAALACYSPQATYTTTSLTPFTAELAALRRAAAAATDATFPAVLKAAQAAVKKLELLNPRLAADQSLDWSRTPVKTVGLVADRVAQLLDGDYTTSTGDLRAPFTIDFGEHYRVSASAFGIQARFMFANRSKGANVYGSNDNIAWTLLSSRATTDTSTRDFAMEVIPVAADKAGEKFRYLMVRVDHPGVPTDPAYPGLSSFGEFRIYGTRHDLLAGPDLSARTH